MKIHQLAPKQSKSTRRRGRGNGSKAGTFCGRGCNGQNARSGGGVRLGFEGGQTPLIQRMPKNKGFRNINRVETQVVSLEALEGAFKDGEKVNLQTLVEKKLISTSRSDKIKILSNGAITKKVEIESPILVSATAAKAIEKAGGKVVEQEPKESK